MQSLLMFQTLHLIDRDYYQQFGWRQATIWAIEEPESSLHTKLEAEVGRFLAAVSNEDTGRLQSIATTHSDIMLQYADSGYIVEKEPLPLTGNPLGTVARKKAIRELLEYSARFGISRWVNPILRYPLDAVILVEGKSDRDFILECVRLLQLRQTYRVECLEDLTGESGRGGVDALLKFIKSNADAILSRPKEAPVIVVLDWDARNHVRKFENAFTDANEVLQIVVWKELQANPTLDSSFHGIERFYSDRMINEADQNAPGIIGMTVDSRKVLPSDSYGRIKQALAKVVAQGLKNEDIVFAKEFVQELHEIATKGSAN